MTISGQVLHEHTGIGSIWYNCHVLPPARANGADNCDSQNLTCHL